MCRRQDKDGTEDAAPRRKGSKVGFTAVSNSAQEGDTTSAPSTSTAKVEPARRPIPKASYSDKWVEEMMQRQRTASRTLT